MAHMLVGGFLPFCAISVELYYIFASVRNDQILSSNFFFDPPWQAVAAVGLFFLSPHSLILSRNSPLGICSRTLYAVWHLALGFLHPARG